MYDIRLEIFNNTPDLHKLSDIMAIASCERLVFAYRVGNDIMRHTSAQRLNMTFYATIIPVAYV